MLDRVIPEQFMFVWKKNPNYWNKANEDFKAQYVVYRSSPVVDSAIEEFKRAQSDMVNHGIVTFTHMKAIQDDDYKPMLIETRFRDPCPRRLLLQHGRLKGVLADPRGRWALSSLIDRDKIGNNVWLMKTPAARFPWADYKSNSQWENAALAGQYKLAYDPKKGPPPCWTTWGPRRARTGSASSTASRCRSKSTPTGPGGAAGARHRRAGRRRAEQAGHRRHLPRLHRTVWTTKWVTGDYDIWSGWICGADFDPERLFTNYQSDRAVPIGQTAASGNEVRLKEPSFDAVTKQLDVSDPSDTKNKPLFDKALEEYYKALPTTPIIQTTYPVCTNTTYWTGWPTDDDLYQVPLGWWGQFRFVLGRLKPTGKK